MSDETMREAAVPLREAAELALMYLRTGFMSCEQCGHEIKTADLDAVWQLKEGLATRTPAPVAGEGGIPAGCDAAIMRKAIGLTIADASYHLKRYRPHCLEALENALVVAPQPPALAQPQPDAGEVERLREALAPFAACADELDGSEDVPLAPDGEWAKFRLLTDDYRRARAALATRSENR